MISTNKFSVLIVVFLVLLFSFSVYAEGRKGVGLMWNTESVLIEEGNDGCIIYGIYNPWDLDVTAQLDISDSLREIFKDYKSVPKFIPAKTYSNSSEEVEICFYVPEVYPKDCLIGGFVCEKSCDYDMKTFEGSVMVNEVRDESYGGITGSAVSLGVSSPLRVRVKCVESSRDWTLVYVFVFVISVIMVISLVYLRNNSKNKKRAK